MLGSTQSSEKFLKKNKVKNKWHCASSIAKREKKDTLTSICSLLVSVPSINSYIVLSLKKANKETKLAESEPADTFLHRGVWTPSNSSVNWSKAKVLYHVSYCQDDLTRRECVCNTVLSQGPYKGAYIHILLIRPSKIKSLWSLAVFVLRYKCRWPEVYLRDLCITRQLAWWNWAEKPDAGVSSHPARTSHT